MIKANLFSRIASGELFATRIFDGFPPFRERAIIQPTSDYIGGYATFSTATRTGAGTTAMATPVGGGSLILTDLIISGERQVASTTEVQFTDGTNSESIFIASAVDQPPSINHSFRARMQGWKDARIDFITTGTADATVMIGYVKVSTGIEFADWDSRR